MESEWRTYLKDHAPELYEMMLSEVVHNAKWRDEKIARLESDLAAAQKELAEAKHETEETRRTILCETCGKLPPHEGCTAMCAACEPPTGSCTCAACSLVSDGARKLAAANRIVEAFRHMHVGPDETCAKCGLDLRNAVESVPGHQSACFAGERQEKRGLK